MFDSAFEWKKSSRQICLQLTFSFVHSVAGGVRTDDALTFYPNFLFYFWIRCVCVFFFRLLRCWTNLSSHSSQVILSCWASDVVFFALFLAFPCVFSPLHAVCKYSHNLNESESVPKGHVLRFEWRREKTFSIKIEKCVQIEEQTHREKKKHTKKSANMK